MSTPPSKGLARLWSVPLAGRTAVVCAVLLTFPFCFAGIFMDDYFHQLILDQQVEVPMSRWELFTFAWGDSTRLQPLIEYGPYPWWTLPEVQFSFVRPLSVALAQLDHLAFGRAFFWHHLHSLVWYVALAAVATAVFRRALGAFSPVAALATVLFAVSGPHVLPAGWLANRNAMVATVPALLGVVAHVRWREQRDRWALPLSVVCYLVGLSGGEAALGALAYLVAYELAAAAGSWRSRLGALVPAGLVGIGYVVLYRVLGAGAFGSEMYLDPIREPLRFLLHAPAKALALAASQFFTVSAQFWMVNSEVRPLLASAGAVALGLVALLLRRLWPALDGQAQRGVRWLSLGAALSLVPVLATFPMDRLLLMPSLGASAVLAVVFRHGLRAGHDRLLRYGARLLFGTALVLGVGAWPIGWVMLPKVTDFQIRTALDTNFADDTLTGRVLVFVAPDPTSALYLHRTRVFHGKPRARSWLTLSFAPYAHRLTRVAPDAVELEVVNGRMLETVFEQLVRSSSFPVPEGMQVRLDGADLTVVGLDRGLPSRLRLRFHEPPEGGGYTFAHFAGGKLSPLVLPAVGQTLELPKHTGLLSL